MRRLNEEHARGKHGKKPPVPINELSKCEEGHEITRFEA